MKKTNIKNYLGYFSLALMVTLVFAGCGKGCGKKDVSQVEAESFQLIPLGSNFVVGLNWEQISKSPLADKMTQEVPPGIAPLLKEIKGVTMGFSVQGVGQEPQDFVAVVSGKLDADSLLKQLKEQAQKDGRTVNDQDYEGVKIYSTDQDPSFGVAFLQGKGVVGKISGIKKVVDLSKNKGESIEKNKSLMDMIQAVDTSKMLWAVGVVPAGAVPAVPPGGGANPLGALSGVKALDLSLDYYNDLIVDLGIIAGAEEEAQQMMTMANSYKTLFGTSLAQKDPNLGKVLSALIIDVKGTRLTISLKLDKKTVEEISNKADKAKAAPLDDPSQAAGGPGAEES